MTSRPSAAVPDAQVLGRVLLPLRAFLGFTFCFAGLQKLANPRFFDASDPASIQSQLAGAARRSPVHALISPLAHVAVPLGIVIALGELAVGVGTLLGFRARIAAAGGIALALMLFLTVSFHSAPYYTGADIVFVFAWTPLLLAGSGSVLSLDAAIARWAGQRPGSRGGTRAGAGAGVAIRCPRAGRQPPRGGAPGHGDRRGRGGDPGRRRPGRGAGPAGRRDLGRERRAEPACDGRILPGQLQPVRYRLAAPSLPAAPGHTPAGQAIGPASGVPVGQAASFTDPSSGDPSIVIQPRAGTFVAFDVVCPHAGCPVGYDAAAKVITCPCHGSQFNAATGAVEVGPATTGLTKLAIAEGSNGQLYVT